VCVCVCVQSCASIVGGGFLVVGGLLLLLLPPFFRGQTSPLEVSLGTGPERVAWFLRWTYRHCALATLHHDAWAPGSPGVVPRRSCGLQRRRTLDASARVEARPYYPMPIQSANGASRPGPRDPIAKRPATLCYRGFERDVAKKNALGGDYFALLVDLLAAAGS